ncbi:MAG: FAD-dependent oxidoreductase, partial [Longimicrobiales bacterium]|nr:FAD-dependent oxidoreductase [Longimicrobiales bacterium]
MSSDTEVVDLLVIGGGIAGGTCALRAADNGLKVLTVVKSADPRSTATEWAQGGIVAEGDQDP